MIDLALQLIKTKPIYVKAIGNKFGTGKNYKFRKFYRFRFNFSNDLIIRINTHGI